MANTETTSSAAFGWRPDVSVFQPADVVRESLYLTCATVSGRIEGDEVAMHVAYCDDDDADRRGRGRRGARVRPGVI